MIFKKYIVKQVFKKYKKLQKKVILLFNFDNNRLDDFIDTLGEKNISC